MDDIGGHLLGHEREAALLPCEPRRAMTECRRPSDHSSARREPKVPFLVRPLADNGEVRASGAEGAYQTVNIAAERSPVRGDIGRVNQYPQYHNSQAYACSGR